MYLDTEKCNFEILDILRLKRKKYIRADNSARDFTVISCRLSGETLFVCGQNQIKADPDNYVIVPAGVNYTQSSPTEDIICLHVDINGLELGEIKSFYCPSPQLKQSFIMLYDLWKTKERGYILKCKSLIYDILFEFERLSSSHDVKRAQTIMLPTIKYIYENYTDKNFSLSQAIDASHISPAYFRRLFKGVYGTTPNIFVNRLKIEKAKMLISEQTHTLSEISERCGFLNEKYFFSVFKKTVGSTPTEWSRTHI